MKTEKGLKWLAAVLALCFMCTVMIFVPHSQYIKASGQISLPVLEGVSDGIFIYRQIDSLAAYEIVGVENELSGTVAIPAECDGMKIAAIGKEAFKDNTEIIDVYVPNTVQSIGEGAFSGCTALREVNVENTLQSVGKNAFAGTAWYTEHADEELMILDDIVLVSVADTVTQLSVPSGITVIADSACECRIQLTFVSLVSSAVYIGARSFYGCTSLREVIIPSGIKYIGDYAFSESAIEYVVLPATVLSVGKGAFKGCTYLEQAAIWDGIMKMGRSAFAFCTSLKQITLPDSLTDIGSAAFKQCTALQEAVLGSRIDYIPESMFQECVSLSSVTLGSKITSIGTAAFNKCTALERIGIPDSVTYIGSEAFQSCIGLRDVHIPDSVLDIGKNAFFDTAFYNILRYSSENDFVIYNDTVLLGYYGSDSVVNIPEGVRIVGGAAFAANETIEYVVLPSTIKRLSSYAFENLWTMRSITGTERIEYLGDYAFGDCASLSGIVFSDLLSTISEGALSGCEGLIYAELGNGVSVIESDAFSFTGLSFIVLPESVELIENYAFLECSFLEEITIYNRECVIKNFSIPSSVTVKGYSYSTAHKYANNSGNDFYAIDEQTVTSATGVYTTTTITSATSVCTTFQTTTTTTTTEPPSSSTTTTTVSVPLEGNLMAGTVEVNMAQLEADNYKITLPVFLENTDGWKQLSYGFAFDNEMLSVDAVKLYDNIADEVAAMGCRIIHSPAINHELGVLWSTMEVVGIEDTYIPDGSIVYITLSVSPDVQPGDMFSIEFLSENGNESHCIETVDGKGVCSFSSGCIYIATEPPITTTTTTATTATTTTTTTTATTGSEVMSSGDMNGDGEISINDAVIILSIYAAAASGKEDTITELIPFADVNEDGKVDTSDAALVLKYYCERSASLTEKGFDDWRVAQ